ncbi:import motor complex subunit [Saccharomycopsis crataegensis]|uniref:Mitochondrial import inner membrane translocase subunit TIM16 n=1 Tax=Saccharomycopsis crataegensis TaxID=43959 RepID=A0AAV5QTT1_9ASCO|nr:import motor complex subunit [Saccharomycopsis crataegensis]
MAHRILVNVIFTGAKVFGTAFSEAYKQAASAGARQSASAAAKAAAASANGGIQLDEACKILDLDMKKDGLSESNINEKYDYLFNVNNKEKGGSFYVQSKVYYAKERLLGEINYRQELKKETENQ